MILRRESTESLSAEPQSETMSRWKDGKEKFPGDGNSESQSHDDTTRRLCGGCCERFTGGWR